MLQVIGNTQLMDSMLQVSTYTLGLGLMVDECIEGLTCNFPLFVLFKFPLVKSVPLASEYFTPDS